MPFLPINQKVSKNQIKYTQGSYSPTQFKAFSFKNSRTLIHSLSIDTNYLISSQFFQHTVQNAKKHGTQ